MHRLLFAIALPAVALGSVALPGVAAAQSDVGARVGKLESEMRAVQRKVFPGGAGQYLQPEVTAAPSRDGPGPGVPATSAVADLTARVGSLEGQMATLTGQIEQNQYRLRQLQDAFDAYRRSTDAKFAAGAAAPASTGAAPRDDDPAPRPARAPARDDEPASRPARPVPRPAAAASPAPAVTSVDRAASAAAGGDPGEEAYMAGYRLWADKRYPEAEAQLKKVVADYPKSKRASYAQNLLGRSYLDEGKPSLASMAFYDNYKKMPDGERAPDSLYFLAQSLMKLNKPADACKVYGELTDVYGAKVSAEMKANVAKGRAAAKCR
jgi:TolA-binding protein